MRQEITEIVVSTTGQACYEITGATARFLKEAGCRNGLLTAFIRHTSASLVIQENADRDVQLDMVDALDRLVPQNQPFRHTSEGLDDMPAHVKSALTATSLCIPVKNGQMVLGTWQGLFVIEHRSMPHRRKVVLHFIGA